MTPIFFLVVYFLGLILAFVRHPIYGLYSYLFAFYMAPSYGWWRNDVPDLRYMMIAAVVAAIASLRMPPDPNRVPWHKTKPATYLGLFVLLNWMQLAWAFNFDAQFEAAVLYTKHLISFYLVYRFCDSIESIKQISFIHILGCAWFGYQAFGASGGRLETVGGPVAGSNELGVHISTGIIFGGIMLMTFRGIRRWITLFAIPLAVNCLILTISRGAFLGFFASGIAGYLAIPKRFVKTYTLFGVLGLVLFSMLAHDALIERFTDTFLAVTSTDEEIDRSAASRIEIAKAGIAIGLDHPFGAGSTATERMSGRYLTLFDKGRAAHNTLAEVFAEHGFPGLILYLLTVAWVARTLLQYRRQGGPPGSESEDLGSLLAMNAAALLGIYVSGNFSTNIGLETQYWCLAMLASVVSMRETLVAKAAAADVEKTEEHKLGRAPLG